MKSILFALVAALVALPAAAAPQKNIHVRETVDINAPADKAWDIVKNYDALPSWNAVFAKDEITSGTNNKVGAVRKLTVKDGPSFDERLTAYNVKGRTYTYTILDANSPLPLKNYKSTLTVKSTGKGKSQIVWVADFKRKNPDANPPEAESDAGLHKFISGVFRTGLDAVKKTAEGG